MTQRYIKDVGDLYREYASCLSLPEGVFSQQVDPVTELCIGGGVNGGAEKHVGTRILKVRNGKGCLLDWLKLTFER